MTGSRLVLILSLLTATGGVAFSQDAAPAPTPGAVPGSTALAGLSPEAVMELMNEWGMQSDVNKVGVWTTSREMHFTFADGTKTTIALPADRMVVSIAPYIMKTHPCATHTPSSCRGEQVSTPVKVTAVTADGRTVLQLSGKTNGSGFVDLWLPRGEQIDVTVEMLGLTASERIATSDADITCITTLKLHY